MAKFELKFISEGGNYLSVQKCPDSNLITIYNDIIYFEFDKSTAIKFAKTLRTEINKITESENLIDGGSSFSTLEKGNFTTLIGTPKKGGQNGNR